MPDVRPWHRGRSNSPLRPAGVPGSARRQPGIAVSVEPVPAADRIPRFDRPRAHHAPRDAGMCNRTAEVVIGMRPDSDLLTQGDRFFGSVDRDLEFRFPVFFEADVSLTQGPPPRDAAGGRGSGLICAGCMARRHIGNVEPERVGSQAERLVGFEHIFETAGFIKDRFL